MKKSTSNIKSDMPDPSFWVDYEALSHQINTLMVYYKPSTFKTKIEISDSSQKGQIERKGSTHEWHVLPKPLILGKCRNEPFYIFSESMDTERIIINLSQMGYTDILYPEETSERSITVTEKFTECDFCLASLVKRVKGNITKEEVKDYISVKKIEQVLVKHYRSVSHIVVEEFNWKTDKLGATVTSMNTYGAKTTTLSLPPGRKTLKLWIKSDTPCTVQIFSDALVTIGGLETILTAMLAESKLLEDMCIQVANCFGNLVEAFGTPEFPSKLKAFYESYKPQESLTKAESVLVHDKFYCLLYELVEENPNKEEAYALKVLLFRWQLPLYKEYPENYDLCSCYNEVDLEFLKVTEQYAVRIQAFFRGVYERCLMKRHSMSHKGYKSTTENLLNIYSTIFSVESRFNMCPNLIRTFLAHPDMEKLKKKYNIFHDLENVLTLKQIEGIVKIIENQWTFLCRHQFCVTSKNPIPIRINLFCNIDEYVVRVIDNDTNEEIRRYTNNVAVNEYKPNLRGYTVFCYAWPTSSQNLSYRLTFASKKEVDCDRFTLLTDSPNNFILQGMYIPNVNDTVCKYLVNVRSEHALISINFVPCFEDAVLNLRLCDSQNRVVKELTGKGRVLFPAICLKNQNKSSNDPVAAKSSINTIKKGRVPSKLSQKMQDKKPRQSVQIKKLRLKVEDQRSGTGSQGYEPRLQPSGSIYARAKPPSPQWSGKDLGKNLNVEEPVVYRIEVTVLDDSWPLNAAEWRSVENMKSHKPEPVQEK